MRRIVCSIIETTEVMNDYWALTYGIPLKNKELKEIKNLTDNDLFIPRPRS